MNCVKPIRTPRQCLPIYTDHMGVQCTGTMKENICQVYRASVKELKLAARTAIEAFSPHPGRILEHVTWDTCASRREGSPQITSIWHHTEPGATLCVILPSQIMGRYGPEGTF